MPTTPATAGPEWIPRKVEHTCMQLCSFSDYSLENREKNTVCFRLKDKSNLAKTKERRRKKKEQKGKRNKRKQNRIEHRLSKNRIIKYYYFYFYLLILSKNLL